ncbi:hypothetical protein ACIPVB_06690 [Microbacterium sp. NPDC090007]|uniref:hypothetical protein n=1 Tax=Microbacterium sp. NPDC090007 TaxID=3364204 RepID=UPI003822DF84
MADREAAMPDELVTETTALQLSLQLAGRCRGPEVWSARIVAIAPDESGAAPVLAAATLHRVHYADPRWCAQLGDAGADLAEVGSAFTDRELISMIDESSLFTESLCVISSIDVVPAAVGTLVSHELVRAVARVFDGDTLALVIPGAFAPADGGAVDDADIATRRAHWAATGFVDIPGTTAMLLPVGARP